VDLIELEDNSEVFLTLEEKDDRHLLIYTVVKDSTPERNTVHEPYPLARATVRA